MKAVSHNKQLIINMSASFVSFGVSLLISFFLSPYIVETIGVEANGFVSLANNFVSYAGLITIALNSLAGRFITISVVQGDEKATNKYFTSVFYANLIIAGILTVAGSLIVIFLERLIDVPDALISDVRLLFIMLFLNCIQSVIGSVFTVATFARNMLYLESLRNIESNVIRMVCIVGLFSLRFPRICYVGAASLISGIYVLFRNVQYTKKLLPQVRIKTKYFDIKAVIELVSSGIWNTINRLGQILMDGLDLLITNLFIDATAMGVLALAKTVPGLIASLMGTVVGVFSPNYTILYAEEKYDELLKMVKQSMKIMGLITNLPIIVLIVCGQEFFALWQPTQDPDTLQILSLFTIGMLVFSGGINCLYSIFTVVNKIKLNSIVVLATSFAGTVVTMIVLHTTNLGIYAVAGVSTVFSILRNLLFTAPYGAYCLKQKWYTFFPEIIRPAIFAVLASLICMLVLRFAATGWLLIAAKACAVCLISGAIGYFIILGASDRRYLLSILKRKKK